MASMPLSIRFDAALLGRLRRGAANHDTTPSGLAQRLVDEGLRAQETPGIVFRDGPSGRRAALAGGPDVWEIVRALRDADARGEAAIAEAAAELSVSERQARTALACYGSYATEVDAEISANELVADEAFRAWERSSDCSRDREPPARRALRRNDRGGTA